VPPWGRPPGAKGSKQRRRWEREQALWQQQEQLRFQELGSDSDIHGVGVDFVGKRFASDPLKFTGIDLSSKPRARRSYTFDESSSDSGSGYSNGEDENESARQIALRDKEEALVQSALARIRRAQERGKSEVKLNPEELAALEKRRKRMQTSATSRKSKKDGASSGSSGSDRRRRSNRAMITVPLVQPELRRRSDRHHDQSPPRASLGAPGMVIEGPNGTISYAPIDYPPSSNKGSPIRPRPSASLQLYAPGGRHFPEGSRPASSNDTRIPLPHEEDWTPISRRSSISSQNYSHDPFDYQISSDQTSPIPTQYVKAPNVGRHVSGPSQVQYSSVKRSPPLNTPSIDRAPYSIPASSPEPILSRQRHGVEDLDGQYSGNTSEDHENSDGYANGGTVELQRERIITTLPARKPIGGARKKGKARRS
jgi:PRA1 family protein 1